MIDIIIIITLGIIITLFFCRNSKVLEPKKETKIIDVKTNGVATTVVHIGETPPTISGIQDWKIENLEKLNDQFFGTNRVPHMIKPTFRVAIRGTLKNNYIYRKGEHK